MGTRDFKTRSDAVLTPSLLHWLADYESSGNYKCSSSGVNCEAFHVLAPALHKMGAFRSYSSYSSVIRNSAAFALSNCDNIKILVAGVDSDESALSLIQALHPVRDWVHITFVDICSTPLHRISTQMILQKPFIKTQHEDIFSYLGAGGSEKFEMILADSFLQQLRSTEREKLLSLFSQALHGASSSLVLREYVGQGPDLIELLWRRYNLGSLDTELLQATPEIRTKILNLLSKLKFRLLSEINTYSEIDHFLLDIEAANLIVKHTYSSSHVADVVCVARKGSHQLFGG